MSTIQLQFQSPRPTPVFFDEPFFSQRKRTPSKVPPKAPSKSCPPVSRVFNNSRYKNGALKISFLSESVNEPIISPHYTAESSQQYFEQCFEIIQKLGEGSFGEVFKVRNKEDGKLYAVKRSRERFNGEWDRRKKLDEVEKHERLSYHPNCVKFHRAWEERLHLFIQTELCLMSLSNYCDMHGKISERRIWRVLYDVVKGLKHLHDNRLCHLDIKPANIFLSQDGVTCKLGDFGLVVSADSGFTEALEGDSCYVAPELLEGRFSMAADIFSLGISLLELVCDLELPSDGPSWQALRTGHLPQEFIKGLSPSLVSLLSQMMSHDPSTRPTVDDLLAHRSLKIVHYTQPVVHLANRIIPVISRATQWTVTWLWHLFILILSLFRLTSTPTMSHDQDKTPPTLSNPKSLEDYLSDSEDEFTSFYDLPHKTLNGSSIHNGSLLINQSPMPSSQYPLFTGSPIPLKLDESSGDEAGTPLRPGSPLLTSSPAASSVIHSRSDTSQLNRSRRRIDLKHSKSFNGGPKNLMEIFNDTSLD